MGTLCRIHLYADDEDVAAASSNELQQEAERLEQKYSRYRHNSLLSRINASGGARVEVDEETAALFDYADTCFRESGGLFDITSGILRQCWDFKNYEGTPRIPDDRELEAVRVRIGWNKVDWRAPALSLPAGMEIDLGGLVKEYAADCMTKIARERGAAHGLIELGGDIAVIGPHPGGKPWQLGIANPVQPETPVATIALSHGALATSGTYERCFTLNGKLYHHILNPLTGRPVSGLVSASVASEHCLIAGSAATIALLKEDLGLPWLESLGLPWLGLDNNRKPHGTLIEATM